MGFLGTLITYSMMWIQILFIPFVILKWLVDNFCGFCGEQTSLEGKIVLITGGGSGIGQQLALEFAKAGSRIICVDINSKGNDATVELLKEQTEAHIESYTCDISKSESINELKNEILKKNGHIDILVNNAGVAWCSPFMDYSEEHIKKMFDINVFAHFWLIRAFLPKMLERGSGHIVAISSAISHYGIGYLVPYSTSKSAVSGLMHSLYHELRTNEQPIKTLTVHPGFTITPILNKEFQTPGRFEYNFLQTSKYLAEQIVKAVKSGKRSITVPRPYQIFIYIMDHILPEFLRNIASKYSFNLKEFTKPLPVLK